VLLHTKTPENPSYYIQPKHKKMLYTTYQWFYYKQHKRVSYKKQELREHLGSPQVLGGVRVAHLYSFGVVLCWVFFVFYVVFILCLVCPMLPVSLLDWTFRFSLTFIT
jgi:hypothetical protein